MKSIAVLLICLLLTATSVMAAQKEKTTDTTQKQSFWNTLFSFFTGGKEKAPAQPAAEPADEKPTLDDAPVRDVADNRFEDFRQVTTPDTAKGACMDLQDDIARVREELEATEQLVNVELEQARAELEQLRGMVAEERSNILSRCDYASSGANVGETCTEKCNRAKQTCMFGIRINGGQTTGGSFLGTTTPETTELVGCNIPLQETTVENRGDDFLRCYCC